jgi:hypothetical protein
MSEIDWSTAPASATHFKNSNGRYYKILDDSLLVFGKRRKWALSEHSLSDFLDGQADYQSRLQQWPAEDRIQNIGQNGGDGLHYDEQREQHEAKHDQVNNPKHYAIAPGVEAIDIIKASLTPEQFKGYLLGNFLKYRLRAGDKDDLQQDIYKSNWYRQKLTGQTSQS